MKTSNKGVDWQIMSFDGQSLNTISEKFTHFSDVCFASTSRSWIVGDGGIVDAVINEQNLKVSSIFSTKEKLYSVSCNDSGEVWAVGRGGAVFHYQNGWGRIKFDNKYVFQRVISKENEIWLLGADGTEDANLLASLSPPGILLRSQDNGQTWENKTPESASWLYDLFLKDGKGWLVGAGGHIYLLFRQRWKILARIKKPNKG